MIRSDVAHRQRDRIAACKAATHGPCILCRSISKSVLSVRRFSRLGSLARLGVGHLDPRRACLYSLGRCCDRGGVFICYSSRHGARGNGHNSRSRNNDYRLCGLGSCSCGLRRSGSTVEYFSMTSLKKSIVLTFAALIANAQDFRITHMFKSSGK